MTDNEKKTPLYEGSSEELFATFTIKFGTYTMRVETDDDVYTIDVDARDGSYFALRESDRQTVVNGGSREEVLADLLGWLAPL